MLLIWLVPTDFSPAFYSLALHWPAHDTPQNGPESVTLRRYQVCLFCFERIKRDCSNLCPGCRTEYGSEKDPFQKGEARQRGTSAPSNGGATPQKARAATSQRSSPMPSPSKRQTVRSQRAGAQSHSDEQPTSPGTDAPEPSGHPLHTRNTQGQPAAAGTQDHDAWETALPAGQSTTPDAAERDDVLGQPSSRRQSEDVTTSAGPHGSQASLSTDGARTAGMGEQGSGPRFRWPSASETLQSAAMKVGWGSWRLQKRRPDTPASDPEVRSAAAHPQNVTMLLSFAVLR